MLPLLGVCVCVCVLPLYCVSAKYSVQSAPSRLKPFLPKSTLPKRKKRTDLKMGSNGALRRTRVTEAKGLKQSKTYVPCEAHNIFFLPSFFVSDGHFPCVSASLPRECGSVFPSTCVLAAAAAAWEGHVPGTNWEIIDTRSHKS